MGEQAKLRKGGTQAVYFCPFCKHYKRKLEINLEYGMWHCWTCNSKGVYLGSLFTKLKVSRHYRERLFELTKDVRLRRKSRRQQEFLSLPFEFIPLIKPSTSPEYKNAMWYLFKRKVSYEDIVRYNIGYCEEGEYKNHIIIPSYDYDGILNFFIGRTYYDGEYTYRKPQCSMNIVGFECLINYNEPINLVEGVFDAIAVRNNAVPLFGKFMSPKLKESLIMHESKRVNMILDNDALGDALKNSIELMKLGIDVHLVKLEEKDASVIGFEKINELIDKSESLGFKELVKYKLEE